MTHDSGARRPLGSDPGPNDAVDGGDGPPGADGNGHRVVAVLPAELRSRFEKSILGRDDLNVRYLADPSSAIELAFRNPPALLMLYDTGVGNLASLLPSLKRAVIASPFPVIVLAEFPDEGDSDWISARLPVDVDPGKLSTTVARLLSLPSRAGRRHLIRVGVELDDPSSFTSTGNTVDISATGALIECNRRLKVGFFYQSRILGVSGVPTLGLRVVREAEAGHPNLHRYGCAFEDVEPEVVEDLIRRLGS